MKIALALTLLSFASLSPAFANGVERGAEIQVPSPVYMPLIKILSPSDYDAPCEFSGDPNVKGPDGCVRVNR